MDRGGKYPVYSSQTTNNGIVGYTNEYLYENAVTWTTDGANAGDVNYRSGKFYCTNVCGVLLNDYGNANIAMANIINRKTKSYVSYVGNPKLMNNIMSIIKISVHIVEEQEISLLKKQNKIIFNYIYSQLPIEFVKVKLSEIASGFDYGMNSAAIPFDGVNSYIRITDIDENDRSYVQKNLVSPLERVEDKYIVNNNDILITRTGASVGKNYLYNKEDGKIYFAGFLIRINVLKSYSKYTFQFMDSSYYWKYISINSARSGQPGINAYELMNMQLNVPKDETIANNLGNNFGKVNLLRKNSEKELQCYKNLKTKLLREMLV